MSQPVPIAGGGALPPPTLAIGPRSPPTVTVGFATSPPAAVPVTLAPPRPESGTRPRIVLLENVSSTAVELFERHGFEVEFHKKAMSDAELTERLRGAMAVGIRSKTQLTASVLAEAKDLVVIGAFCIGTNQIDLKKAEELGIPVFNSPFSNSRSVAELTIAEIVALARRVSPRNIDMHRGIWNPESAATSIEIRGKTLGIIGYGHIGSQLSVLADALGMRVIYTDVLSIMPLGSATQVPLDDLLRTADFVSLHVPELPSTKLMIREEQLAMMKPGSFLINNSRGSVVDIAALARALRSGHLAGAAVDVFPKEPKENGEGVFDSELRDCPNVILTPHIGGSTEEAQRAIGVEVANAIIRYVNTGSTIGAVNFPEIDLPLPTPGTKSCRILNIHENVPGVLKQVNRFLAHFGIERQAQDSNDKVAYLMADITYSAEAEVDTLLESINNMTENIRSRVLFNASPE